MSGPAVRCIFFGDFGSAQSTKKDAASIGAIIGFWFLRHGLFIISPLRGSCNLSSFGYFYNPFIPPGFRRTLIQCYHHFTPSGFHCIWYFTPTPYSSGASKFPKILSKLPAEPWNFKVLISGLPSRFSSRWLWNSRNLGIARSSF